MIEVGFWQEHDGLVGPLLGLLIKRPKLSECRKPDWIYRTKVVAYLRKHRRLYEAYYGEAKCALCGEWIGNKEYTDGTFVWPEGLLHYVERHDIEVPQSQFVARAIAQR